MRKTDAHATLLEAYLEEVCDRWEHRRRAPSFRQWQKAWLSVPLAAGLSLAATACSGESKRPTEECAGPSCAQLCSDNVDNDADGAVDCDDEDCADVCVGGGSGGAGGSGAGPVYSAPLEDCTNGTDDDGDQLVDCNDADCADAPGCMGADYAVPLYAAVMVENCDNGADEDGDGLIDCDDPDCNTSGLCLGLEYGVPMPNEKPISFFIER